MSKKVLYSLFLVFGSITSITVLYIEFQILSEMVNFEEPRYDLPTIGISLSGYKATLAHIANFTLGLLAIIVTVFFYEKLRDLE